MCMHLTRTVSDAARDDLCNRGCSMHFGCSSDGARVIIQRMSSGAPGKDASAIHNVVPLSQALTCHDLSEYFRRAPMLTCSHFHLAKKDHSFASHVRWSPEDKGLPNLLHDTES